MEETVTKKGIIGVLLAIVTMFGTVTGAAGNSKKAFASEDFHTWSQMDSRWSGTALGGTTIGASGCYVTSIAMVAVASGAKDTDSFNPGVFGQQLNERGAFSWDGGLMSWASVNNVIPEVRIETPNLYFNSSTREGKASEMKYYLDQGLYVICDVGGHWVYVDSISGEDIRMADPAKTETDLYSAYSNVYCYQALSGKNPYGSYSEPETTTETTTTITSTTTTTTMVVTTTNNTTTTVSSNAESTTTASTTIRSALFTAPLAVIEKTVNGGAHESDSAIEESTTTTTIITEAETETMTTTAAIVTVPKGEYYFTGESESPVYSELNIESRIIASLSKGDIVNITRIIGDFACININGCDAWVSMSELEYAGEEKHSAKGDINGDGEINAVDLSLLNDYLRSRAELPEGISVLRRCEVSAADVNGDDVIDNNDVLAYLMLICD